MERVTLSPASGKPVDILARTLWGEARGESVRGKEAVAAVVVNRVRHARAGRAMWWGRTISDVCLKPDQFSCWSNPSGGCPDAMVVVPGDPCLAVCVRIARRAVAGVLEDPTGGATCYHARSVHPRWAWSRIPSAEVGEHIFYTIVE